MDGKQYFQECCKQAGINFEDTFVFGEKKDRHPKRYDYRLPHDKRDYPRRFAVLYIKASDLYIAWNLHRPLNRYVLYVSAKAINQLEPGSLHKIAKALGHQGYGEEIVYAFDRSAVPKFLKNVK